MHDGQRVRNFLNDEAVKNAFAEMETENHEVLLAAVNDEQRTMAWAQAVVLARFCARMNGLMQDGESMRQAILSEESKPARPARK